MSKAVFFTLYLLSQIALLADSVTLDNGLVLTGRITQIYLNKLTLETDYSEPIIIKFKKVKSFTTSTEQSIKFSDQHILTGTFFYDGKTIRLSNQDSAALDATSFQMLWPKNNDAPDYIPPFQTIRNSKVSVDINKEKGNSDETEVTIKASTKITREDDTLRASMKIERTEKKGVLTEDELKAALDYEHQFQVKGAWYLRLEVEKDEFEDLSLRVTTAGGYSHYFINDPTKMLRTRFGLLLRKEEYQDSSNSQETVGLDLGLKLKYQIAEATHWYTNLTYTPSIEDYENYRIEHESGISFSINGSDRWKLKLGVEHEYNSRPVTEINNLDTTYFTRIELNF